MSRRERVGAGARTASRWVGRAIVLLALVAGVASVSAALASVGRERPSTEAFGRDQGAVADDGRQTQYGPTAGRSPRPGISVPEEQSANRASPAQLVAAEDERLLSLVRRVPFAAQPYRVDSRGAIGSGTDTLVLTPRTRPWSLSSLVNLGAATRLSDDSLYLTDSVLVAPGASLHLVGDRLLRMRSDDLGFASIVAWKGGLELRGRGAEAPLQLVGWDLDRASEDVDTTNGRAYVRAVKTRVVASDLSAEALGFWSGPTGGIAVTHARGFSMRTSTVRDSHYGLFVSDVDGATIDDVVIQSSSLEGVLVHGGSRDVEVLRTTVQDSGRHGIAVVRGSEGLSLSEVRVVGSAADGVRIDGGPLAQGASAGGADTRRYGAVEITDSVISSNGGAGVSVVDAKDVSITQSAVTDNLDGVVVRGRAKDVTVQDNVVRRSGDFGIAATDGPSDVSVTGNSVSGADTGIAVRRALAVLMDNTVSSARRHGISLVGDSGGSQVVNNTLAGHGPSAISLSRLQSPGEVLVNGNSVAEWVVDRDLTWWQRLEENPLLLLWIPLLVTPILMTVASRRRRRRPRPARLRPVGPSELLHAVGTPPTAVRAHHVDEESSDQPASRTKVTVVA